MRMGNRNRAGGLDGVFSGHVNARVLSRSGEAGQVRGAEQARFCASHVTLSEVARSCLGIASLGVAVVVESAIRKVDGFVAQQRNRADAVNVSLCSLASVARAAH